MGSNIFSAISYKNTAGNEIFNNEFMRLEQADIVKAASAIRALENFGNFIARKRAARRL